MRVVKNIPNIPKPSIFIRALSGEELMLLIGWNKQMWSESMPGSLYSENLLTSLVGNAYSAYCIGPVLITALALAGHVQELSESINSGKRKREDNENDDHPVEEVDDDLDDKDPIVHSDDSD